jgi:phage terminase small subunit
MPKFGENMTKEQSVAGLRRLNKKQQDFLNNYVHKDMTQTAAARAVGYSNPTVDAVRLLRIPAVQERLDEMRTELESKFGVTVAKSVRDLQNIRDVAFQNGKYGDAIRAEELRLKATGLLVNRSHVKHENVDALTREQILDKLGNFMEIAQKRMKDITPIPDNPKKIVKNSEKNKIRDRKPSGSVEAISTPIPEAS